MGNKASVQGPYGQEYKNVFAREQEILNSMVNGIMTKRSTYKNPNYDRMSGDLCNDFTVVLESSLKKHLKVELSDLKDAIFIIPKSDHVYVDKKAIKKEQLCKVITNHYKTILQLLTMIKRVYDTEHMGDYSMAGICFRNVRIINGVLEINFCGSKQVDNLINMKSASVDMTRVFGMSEYLEFLNKVERNIFLRNLQNQLLRKSRAKHGSVLACGDDLVSADKYKSMHPEFSKAKCDVKLRDSFKMNAQVKTYDHNIQVVENAPILSLHSCTEKKRIFVPIHTRTSEVKRVIELYNKMRQDYNSSIREVVKLLDRLIYRRGDKYLLHDIDNDTLRKVIKEVKETIAVFYQQSILNYQSLLDFAKTIPNIKIDWPSALDGKA